MFDKSKFIESVTLDVVLDLVIYRLDFTNRRQYILYLNNLVH